MSTVETQIWFVQKALGPDSMIMNDLNHIILCWREQKYMFTIEFNISCTK